MAQLFPNKKGLDKGFGVIEALVGISLAAIFLTVFLTLSVQAIKVSRANIGELRATMYLQEMIEVSKDLEQSNWNKITTSTCTNTTNPEKYYPVSTTTASGTEWALITGEEHLENNNYVRSLIILNVWRNDPFNFPNEITTSTCDVDVNYNDPNTKKVIANISWYDGYQSRTSTMEIYIYNYTP